MPTPADPAHTPGPWRKEGGFIVGKFNTDGADHGICDPACAPMGFEAEMDANAALITIAPGMHGDIVQFIAAMDACTSTHEAAKIAKDFRALFRRTLGLQ